MELAGVRVVRLERELNRVRDFYKVAGYAGDVAPDDVIVGAVRGNNLVGAVRISVEYDVLVLRGMRVLHEFQHQRVGTGILREVQRILVGRECFGIAYAYLTDFYAQIDFFTIDEHEAPEFLQKRIERYRKEQPQREFVVIRRSLNV